MFTHELPENSRERFYKNVEHTLFYAKKKIRPGVSGIENRLLGLTHYMEVVDMYMGQVKCNHVLHVDSYDTSYFTCNKCQISVPRGITE